MAVAFMRGTCNGKAAGAPAWRTTIFTIFTASAGATGYGTPNEGHGIYHDQVTHGTIVESNIIARCSQGGVYINGGSANIIRNNILDEIHPVISTSGLSSALELQSYPVGDSFWTAYSNTFCINWSARTWPYAGWSVARLHVYQFHDLFQLGLPEHRAIHGRFELFCGGEFHQSRYQPEHDQQQRLFLCFRVLCLRTNVAGWRPAPLSTWRNTYGFDVDSITNNPVLNSDYSLPEASPPWRWASRALAPTALGRILTPCAPVGRLGSASLPLLVHDHQLIS